MPKKIGYYSTPIMIEHTPEKNHDPSRIRRDYQQPKAVYSNKTDASVNKSKTPSAGQNPVCKYPGQY